MEITVAILTGAVVGFIIGWAIKGQFDQDTIWYLLRRNAILKTQLQKKQTYGSGPTVSG